MGLAQQSTSYAIQCILSFPTDPYETHPKPSTQLYIFWLSIYLSIGCMLGMPLRVSHHQSM